MRYGRIGGVGKPVSRLVLGSTSLSSQRLEEGLALLDAGWAAGVNCIDTAHIYGRGDCERVLGQWLASRGVREQAVIVTKGAHPNEDRRRVTPFDIAGDLHDSLARLKTDYIDLYLLHRDDPTQPVGPIIDALNEHLQAGRIHAFGVSNWTHERLSKANRYAYEEDLKHFTASSPNFSLAQIVEDPWEGCVSLSGPRNAAAREWYLSRRMPVLAWSSLGGGFLSGRYSRQSMAAMDKPDFCVRCFGGQENLARLERAAELGRQMGLSVPQVAVAYLLNQPLEVYPLVGCRGGQHIQELTAAVEAPLSPQQLTWLETGRE